MPSTATSVEGPPHGPGRSRPRSYCIVSAQSQAARRVEAQLQAAFRLLEAFPFAGQERREGVRRYALTRYPYVIFYGLDATAGEVRVFTIRHAARRPVG
ncbi:type II toxin-antitoxin system RelE/ParE family toxin [uncultured Enterovirga sp.]|uniref:type II toxin-antitoxin system RelE/ParE family toxin n=1 Tax=uncultured Enterovirga sp. TaxID=2026352 RepID=UPI0035C9FFF6